MPWRSVFAGRMEVYIQGQACIRVAQRLNYLDMGRLGFEGLESKEAMLVSTEAVGSDGTTVPTLRQA